LDAGGETFLDRLAGVFLECGCVVHAVLGHDADLVGAQIRRAARIRIVVNPEPERGQLSSLQCGLRAAMNGAHGIFFSPVDAPGISTATVRALIGQFGSADFVIPKTGERRGHPVLMRAEIAPEFLALPSGATARDVVHAHCASTRYVEVEDGGILDDIDDIAGYERWRKARAPEARR
jgi:CTP:molybdopterin cytidylyltransferase MocA